jgi:maltooligosyltrehalose trehalohydrolase
MWGDALNFDDQWSDGVREYFSENPLHWFENYHIDGLRADAIHMVFDMGAVHLWQLIVNKVKLLEQKAGRKFYLIAESDLNDPKVIKSPEIGGYGFDAQWLDDFHHALYVLLDKQGKERYGDFGQIEQLAKAYTDGFVHSGEMTQFRKRRYGASSAGIPGDKFIVFNQNHDQAGNRVKGERLSVLVDFERLKLAAAAMLLSPYIPLFFMGEEYGEESPFFYFVSHSEKKLVEAVREGRKKEFESFKWITEPPDPQDEKTFIMSKISWKKRFTGNNRILLDWNKKLISMRKSFPALQNSLKNDVRVYLDHDGGFILHRKSSNEEQHLLCFFNFSDEEITFNIPAHSEVWQKILDSREAKWNPETREPLKNLASPDDITGRDTITTYPCSVVVYKDFS